MCMTPWIPWRNYGGLEEIAQYMMPSKTSNRENIKANMGIVTDAQFLIASSFVLVRSGCVCKYFWTNSTYIMVMEPWVASVIIPVRCTLLGLNVLEFRDVIGRLPKYHYFLSVQFQWIASWVFQIVCYPKVCFQMFMVCNSLSGWNTLKISHLDIAKEIMVESMKV